MKKIFVIHYDEIATKGKNRKYFEKQLANNIKAKLPSGKLDILWGRFVIQDFKPDDARIIEKVLENTPGVANFGEGIVVEPHANQSELAENALILMRDLPEGSFAVRVKRVNKSYPQTSQELERAIGAVVFTKLKDKLKVNLSSPDYTLFVEILHDRIFIYTKKPGIGGLPVSASGRAVALLSGGFDSPVASYLMMKRGVRVDFVHFHSVPKTSIKSIEKVKKLASQLSLFNGPSNLFLVPVLDVMQYVHNNLKNPDLKMVILRRSFLRLAQKIAEPIKAHSLITGDSLGQVASQTMENLLVTQQATELLLLRPLVGFSKNEIIDLSRQIGTHDISVLPHDDTCELFVPDHPETKASLQKVLQEETENLPDIQQLEAKALEDKEQVYVPFEIQV